MNHRKITTAGLSLAFGVAGILGLTACSSDSDDSSAPAASAGIEQSASDVATDLQTARQAVLDALADDDWAQVMLASDVDGPTIKYGLMVMPFVQTEAADRVTGTVNVAEDGSFVIEAVSAATGKTWQIDQDGSITEVTE